MNKIILIALVAIALAGEKCDTDEECRKKCATNEELTNSEFGEYTLKYKLESDSWSDEAHYINFEKNDDYCDIFKTVGNVLLFGQQKNIMSKDWCALKTNKKNFTTFKIKGVDTENTFQIFSEDKNMKAHWGSTLGFYAGLYMYDTDETEQVHEILKPGDVCPDESLVIRDAAKCEVAAKTKIGSELVEWEKGSSWGTAKTNIPSGCSFKESTGDTAGTLFFDPTSSDVGQGRSDLAPICLQHKEPIHAESKMELRDDFTMLNHNFEPLGIEPTADFMAPEERKKDKVGKTVKDTYTAIVKKNKVNFCFEKVEKKMLMIPKATDLRIDNIDAYAFSGGGFRALVYQWSVFHALAKPKNNNLQEMLSGKSIGSISGGSWFVNRMLYGPNVIQSFKKEESDNIGTYVKEMIETTMKNLKFSIEQKHDENGDAFQLLTSLCYLFKDTIEKQASYYMEGVCEDESKKLIEYFLKTNNGWKAFVGELHSNFEKTSLHNINWTNIAAINLEFNYKPRNAKLPVYNSKLRSNSDDYTKYPGFPVLSKIMIPENEDGNNKMEIEVDIPKFKGKTDLYIKKDDGDEINITPEQIAEKIKKEIKNPKLHSGPSSNFPGLFAAISFNSNSNVIKSVRVKENVEKYAHRLIWTTEEFESTDGKKSALGLADGGMHDNTGITAAVKNLQERLRGDKKIKTIVAIQPEENGGTLYELKNLFTETTDMPNLKRAKPFPAIFKGNFNGSQVNSMTKTTESGHIKAFVIGDGGDPMETVENEDWGIKGGYKYRLVYIVPKCEKDIPLLPKSGADAIKYGDCAKEIEKLVEMIQKELLTREKKENEYKDTIGKYWAKELLKLQLVENKFVEEPLVEEQSVEEQLVEKKLVEKQLVKKKQKKKPDSKNASSNAHEILGNSWIQFVVIASAALFF